MNPLRDLQRFYRSRPILGFTTTIVIALGAALSDVASYHIVATFRPMFVGLREGQFLTVAEQSRGGALRPMAWKLVRDVQSLPIRGEIGAYGEPVLVQIDSAGRSISVSAVSPDFFATISDAIVFGDGLSAKSQAAHNAHLIVVSESLATQLYSPASAAVGRYLRLNGKSFRIVGLTRSDFKGLFGRPAEAWVTPFSVDPVYVSIPTQSAAEPKIFSARRDSDLWQLVPVFYVVLRASRDAGAVAGQSISKQIRDRPWLNGRLEIVPGLVTDPERRRQTRIWLIALYVLSTCLTLATAFSITSIVVLGTPKYIDDLRIRTILGASHAQALTGVLAGPLLSAIFGIVASSALYPLFSSLLSGLFGVTSLGTQQQPAMWYVSLLDGVLIVILAIIIAAVPIAAIYRLQKETYSSSSFTQSRGSQLVLLAVLACQTGIAICACAIGSILVVSAIHLLHRPVGFKSDKIRIFAVGIKPGTRQLQFSSDSRGKSGLTQVVTDVYEQLSLVPGIKRVAVSTSAPLSPEIHLFRVQSQEQLESISVLTSAVTPSYFDAVGTTFLAGRNFENFNAIGDPSEVVLSRSTAKVLWGDKPDILNRSLSLMDPVSGLRVSVRVVGIVADQNLSGPGTSATQQLYLPLRGALLIFAIPMYVITEGDVSAAMVEAMTDQILSRDFPGLAVTSTSDLTTQLAGLTRMVFAKTAVINAGAISIASIAFCGLYASFLYIAQRRTREMGIRICCGAKPILIFSLLLRQALLGGVIGGFLGYALSKFSLEMIEADLEGVRQYQSLVVISITCICSLLTVAISAPSAVRLSRISPAKALRQM